jgi:hypothetical protein
MRRGLVVAVCSALSFAAAACGGGGGDGAASGGVGAARTSDAALPANTCPDDLALDGGRVRYQGVMVPVGAEQWSWVQANCRNGAGAPNGEANGAAGSGGSAGRKGAGAQPPVLEGLPVDVAAFDLSFRGDQKIMDMGPVVPVGGVVPGHPPEASLMFQFLRRDAQVRAVAPGLVVNVVNQPESCDVEIHVIGVGASGNDASWVMGYDHVEAPTVARGDVIATGQVLGRPGMAYGQTGQCDPSIPGRVELQVNHKRSTDEVAVCPLGLMSAATREQAMSTIAGLMRSWNERVGREVYGPSVIGRGGCEADEVKP